MQHMASPTLSWSAAHQVYELSADQRREQLHLTSEGPAWFAWLDEVSSFAFHGQRGSYTARKESKQRGAGYWYAYRKTQGKLVKKYLGKTADLTLARLEEVAGVLHAARTREPAPSPRAQHETALPHVPEHESRVDLLNPLLATKLHLPRPRVQLVTRSHLVERLQQS